MKVGFETIGNATMIAYDQKPVLVTDPWIQGTAYFGSWKLSHQIPDAQRDAILNCPYVFFSHGHPDHLNPDCISLFQGKEILLADHVGGRIARDLSEQGFKVHVLKDRTWYRLSDQIQIYTIADHFQDSVILVDIAGDLVVNLNDTAHNGWERSVKKIIRQYERSYLLSISGFGDVDMINFYDESGNFIVPGAARKDPVGIAIAQALESFGCDAFVPFSSFHHYNRNDSQWGNQYTTSVTDYEKGFYLDRKRLWDPFVSYDAITKTWKALNVAENIGPIQASTEFGDDWNEKLSSEDKVALISYFAQVEHLRRELDFLEFKVGGETFRIDFQHDYAHRGLTFETPRHSLMISVQYRIFDDLMIGNFVRTTLHGNWPDSKLYPDFIPYLCKYADNGGAYTERAVRAYFQAYRSRSFDFRLREWELKARGFIQKSLPKDSGFFQFVRALYRLTKRAAEF